MYLRHALGNHARVSNVYNDRMERINERISTLRKIIQLCFFLTLVLTTPLFDAFSATISVRLLYPSFAASWATTWIAKEAGYFTAEGLDVELIRRSEERRVGKEGRTLWS